MSALLTIAIYLAVSAFAWVRIYAWLYREHRSKYRMLTWDTGDRVFGVFWGGVVALAWPISAPIFGVIWLVAGPIRSWFVALEGRIEDES